MFRRHHFCFLYHHAYGGRQLPGGSHGVGLGVTVPALVPPMRLIDEQNHQGYFCVTSTSVDGALARCVSHHFSADRSTPWSAGGFAVSMKLLAKLKIFEYSSSPVRG